LPTLPHSAKRWTMPRAEFAASISTIRAALAMARRLIARGLKKGDRIAMIAETGT